MMTHKTWSLFLPLFLLSSLLPQTIVQVFDAPASAWGIDYVDGYLYVGSDADGYLYKVDPNDGSVIATYSTPLDQDHLTYGENHGVVWDSSGFWIAEDYTVGGATLYKIDLNGTVLATLNATTSAVGDLGWDGEHLLVSSYYPNDAAEIKKLDPSTGDVVATVPVQGQQPYGVTFTGSSIWNGMDDNDGDPEIIWELDPVTGEVLSQFDSPAASPKGLAYGAGYLWLVTGSGTNCFVYQINVAGEGTPDIEIATAGVDFGAAVEGEDTVRAQLPISNLGDAILYIIGASTDDTSFFVEAVWPDSGIAIEPGDTFRLPVAFAPQNVGPCDAILTITSSDPIEPQVTVQLSGFGATELPNPILSSTSLTFPPTFLGTTAIEKVDLVNWGIQPLSIFGFYSTLPQFGVAGSDTLFPLELVLLDTITIPFAFSPEVEGEYSGTVFLSTNDADPAVECQGAGVAWPNEGGSLIWSYQGIENVEDVEFIEDIDADGIHDVIVETYDAGAQGDNLVALSGSGSGTPQVIWSTSPEGTAYPSGGWGNKCLKTSGDLDGDMRHDVLLGTAWANETVFAISGATGETNWYFDTHVHDGGGWVYAVAAMEDVNGDGIQEVLAAAGSQNQGMGGSRSIYCFSGATGDVLWRYMGSDAAAAVVSPGDVNGDGIPDAVGGFGGNDLDNRVVAIDGSSSGEGQLLWSYQMTASVQTLTVMGDLDGDSIFDVAAGGWDNRVVVLSGDTGNPLWDHNVGSVVMIVEALPDVTGDDRNEVIVGNWGTAAIVLDGADGSVLWSYPAGSMIWAVSAVPDISGDGKWDVVAGDFDGDVMVIDGVGGTLVWTFNTGGHKVFDVEWIPDVTGNGVADVVVGTQYLGGAGGLAFLLEGGTGFTGLLGDINTDGVIDVFDIVLTIKFILGEQEPTAHQYWAANLDGEDPITVADVLMMVDMILSSASAVSTMSMASASHPITHGSTIMDLLRQKVGDRPLDLIKAARQMRF